MLGWLLALLRAVPSLERLFLHIGQAIKESQAKVRHDAKIDRIDAYIDGVRVSHDTVETGQREKDSGEPQ